MSEDDIRRVFRGCEHPEHVVRAMDSVLRIVDSEVELTPDEWQEVFESLATDVEFREAEWLGGEE